VEKLLAVHQITKQYGDFTANDKINFDLVPGEVHAIVGENGAGKTTLMKMLYGLEKPSGGSIKLRGQEITLNSPMDAIARGIGMVHQHFMLFQNFSVTENITAGHETSKSIWFNRKKAAESVTEISKTYGMPVDPHAKISECSVGMQQRVEILKVLYQGADIIILDEPTAVLTPIEVSELLSAIRGLAKQGKSIILITHKLHEVMAVSDRVTVLRSGRVTGSMLTAETDVEQLATLMVGRELKGVSSAVIEPGNVVLDVKNLSISGSKDKLLLDDIRFQVRSREIVGIAGVSGNGQSELIQALSGLRAVDKGEVVLRQASLTGLSAREIREKGLAHIPEDRYLWGAAKEASVMENALLGHEYEKELHKGWLLNWGSIRTLTQKWVEAFGVKTNSLDEEAGNLSGGNLQKLIVAREFAHGAPFLIAAEPTRGVDIGAMEFIHSQLIAKRDAGDAVLLISSELSEIMKLSDRILVMFEGKIIGELNAAEATEEHISLLMAGGVTS
jgi:ABC-type uncharacterized transport system ATPase subunit